MHIRLAQHQDIPKIVSLGKNLFELHHGFDNDYYALEDNFEEFFSDWVRQQLSFSNNILLVAQENNEIVGFISGFIKSLYPWFRVKNVGHIAFLAVSQNYRRKGVGKKLEIELTNRFHAKNIRYIEVYVEEKNTIAQFAWNNYGFGSFKKFLRKTVSL
ncbi:hypothetical protein A2960_00420 [Candidatus Gottesmanbacteria bacterium RIFCSPLOWO2_01_FULL_39_12b]|uniref:N-acetyltransferase domain-containing protein n=1 Tax=Candidatus Gottesmanbacteria bacterium RIFCSPLOWO2_01_FULL_39_12b TaxID=1798388 RepID=A0A1F6APJ9_9BACT|nr:MAG: hypothetical protein A2960_00420 [Candidatus Gottesmanbacteria bacterium RIFCSPLOWO2_01_FULL_39_12b]